MNRSLKELILVHFRTFFREPAIIFWALIFPIAMAWILGVAFSEKKEIYRIIYVTGESKEKGLKGEKLLGEDTGNPARIKFIEAEESEAIKAIKRGVITLYIEVRNDSLRYHFDPSNPDAQLTHLILERELSGIKQSKAEIAPLTSKGTRYIDFLVPGLIALGILNSCMWGISWTLIEFRMKKLLRRMVATPMKKGIFLSSHIITRILIGGFESVLLITFAWILFDIEITGSISAFVLVFLSGVICFSGIAILTASRAQNSQVGNGLINAVTLPMMILSGIFFNYHNFPEWTIPFIQALPLTLMADSIRAIFIEASEIKDVLVVTSVLTGTGLITFFTGLKLFKWY
jgi:ABC-type multidrug transport system permease subunit